MPEVSDPRRRRLHRHLEKVRNGSHQVALGAGNFCEMHERGAVEGDDAPRRQEGRCWRTRFLFAVPVRQVLRRGDVRLLVLVLEAPAFDEAIDHVQARLRLVHGHHVPRIQHNEELEVVRGLYVAPGLAGVAHPDVPIGLAPFAVVLPLELVQELLGAHVVADHVVDAAVEEDPNAGIEHPHELIRNAEPVVVLELVVRFIRALHKCLGRRRHVQRAPNVAIVQIRLHALLVRRERS
mmetsp:Transcript_38057/g.119445  ORF Transcript_38057/g.119445 Transcript_38057/m.119445 type:complete len:237 (-) Transcript_38057:1176-1886(-)